MSKLNKPAIAYLFPSGKVLVFNSMGQVVAEYKDGNEWIENNNDVTVVLQNEEWKGGENDSP